MCSTGPVGTDCQPESACPSISWVCCVSLRPGLAREIFGEFSLVARQMVNSQAEIVTYFAAKGEGKVGIGLRGRK